MSVLVSRKLTTAWSAAAMPTPARISLLPATSPSLSAGPKDPLREMA